MGPLRRSRRPPVGPEVAVQGSLFGLRTWDLEADAEGRLRLGSGTKQWRADGETTWAVCTANRGGDVHPPGRRAPAPACTCGLYACHPWTFQGRFGRLQVPRARIGIDGLVEAWGVVQLHGEGFRAQFARPVALLLVGCGRDSDYGRLVEDVAIAHRAAVCEFRDDEELLAHCRERGIGVSRRAAAALLDEADPGRVRVGGASARSDPGPFA